MAGLPSIAGPPFKLKRAEILKQQLNELYSWQRADVICLQEVWFPQFRWMVEHSVFPHKIGSRELPMGSGLYILSRFPIGRWSHHTFEQSPRFPLGQLDGEAYVRKGFYLAEILTPQGPIWVGNAHLTSNYAPWGKSHRDFRKAQLEQFFEFAEKQVGNDPFVLAGDFNMGHGEYTEDPIWDDLPRVYPEFQRVPVPPEISTYCRKNSFNTQWTYPCQPDHLFYRNPLSVSNYRLLFQDYFPLSKTVVAHLSDHYGLLVDFHLPLK